MNELCMIIKDTVLPNFLNIRTSIRAYDRDADLLRQAVVPAPAGCAALGCAALGCRLRRVALHALELAGVLLPLASRIALVPLVLFLILE